MNKLIIAVVTLISVGAFAEPTVKLTSFRPVDRDYTKRPIMAEACGEVAGATAFPVFVKLTVDYKSNSKGIYNVVVGKDAVFCAAVSTYDGTVQAEAWQ
jgi:hypothetical protein